MCGYKQLFSLWVEPTKSRDGSSPSLCTLSAAIVKVIASKERLKSLLCASRYFSTSMHIHLAAMLDFLTRWRPEWFSRVWCVGPSLSRHDIPRPRCHPKGYLGCSTRIRCSFHRIQPKTTTNVVGSKSPIFKFRLVWQLRVLTVLHYATKPATICCTTKKVERLRSTKPKKVCAHCNLCREFICFDCFKQGTIHVLQGAEKVLATKNNVGNNSTL